VPRCFSAVLSQQPDSDSELQHVSTCLGLTTDPVASGHQLLSVPHIPTITNTRQFSLDGLTFSALTLLVGRQEGYLTRKNYFKTPCNIVMAVNVKAVGYIPE